MSIDIREQLGIKGHFHLQAFDKDGALVDEVDEDNVILNIGLSALADALVAAAVAGTVSDDTFYAMQIGDDGALATDPMVPKIIDPATTTTMFHELGARTGGAGVFTRTAVANAVQCQQTFAEATYVPADFLDAAKRYVNEAMLFLGKPADLSSAWKPFAMRTFKSIPFGPADAVTALIRWTFEIQRGTV